MNDLKNCIVGVLVNDHLRGTGYIVTEKLVITCAHVLTNEPEPPTQGISVRFHCTDQVCPVTASVDWWSPPDRNDIAVLQLIDSLPAEAEVAALAKSNGRKNHVCEVFGYPDVGDINGLGGRATVIEYVDEFDGRKLVQLESKSVISGYSGSPLLDPESGEIIGTIVEIADQARARYAERLHARLEELAFAIPMEVIAELIPELPIESDKDLEARRHAQQRVRDDIQKILRNHTDATEYLAEQVGVDNEKDPTQRITDHLLRSSLAEFLPLVVRGFTTHARSDWHVAEAFRDLAAFVLPQIFREELRHDISHRLKAGNFVVIPTSHKSIIELVVAGMLGRKLSFHDAWQFDGDIPSGTLQIPTVAERGILHGSAIDKFVQEFERAILQKIGGLPQKMPEPTKAINRKLARLRDGEPPIMYYYVYPDGQSRVEELESRYPDVIFIAHEVTGHDDDEFDVLDSLKDMFCAESDS